MIAYEARESCLPGRGAVPTARGIRVDTKVSTLMNPVSFWDSTAKFAELRLAKEQQSGYFCVSFSAFSQFTDSVLLHRTESLSRRDITVSRNSLVGDYRQHLRIGRLVPFIFVGPVYYNALKNCAALSSPRGPSLALRAIHLVSRLRRLNRMCSSRVSDTA